MRRSRAWPALLLLASCGAGAAAPAGSPGEADAAGTGPDAPSGDAGGADGGVDTGTEAGTQATIDAGSLAARTSAIEATIASNAVCSSIPAFYWEVGDVTGPLASGAVGATFTANTKMNIASASKFVFGAYVVERFKADLSQLDASAMRMLSGYTNLVYDTCVTASTVSDCLSAAKNDTFTPADVGHFYYNGAHFQNYAVTLGLGGDDNDALATAIKSLVGPELSFTYSSPQLAAGINTSALDYAVFLRKLLAGGLALSAQLGQNAVCTQPSSCATALYSPAPAAWHYSYAHWIEDDPVTGDGAFSSPGAFGFYPWIDSTKTFYGVVARYSLESQAYVASAECGAAIRKAFVTGVPRP
jgi:hypothetical protein